MILEMLDFQGYLHFQEIAMISRWPCICWDIFPTTVVKYHVNSCYISDISTKLELQAPGADRKKTQFFPLFFGCPKIGDSFRIPLAAECMEITTGRSSILRWKGLNRCEKSDPCLLNELFGLPQISGSRVLFAGVLKRIFSGEFFNLLLVFFSGRFAVFFASPGSKNTWGRWTMDEKLSEQLGFWGPYEIKGIPVSHRQFWGTLRQAGSTLWLNQPGINNLQYWASQAAKRLQHISTSPWVKILCWMPVKQSSIFGVQTCSSLY